jgi:hypothetical protein
VATTRSVQPSQRPSTSTTTGPATRPRPRTSTTPDSSSSRRRRGRRGARRSRRAGAPPSRRPPRRPAARARSWRRPAPPGRAPCRGLGAAQHGLERHAGDVRALAADPAALHQRHRAAARGDRRRDVLARRAGAEHHDVEGLLGLRCAGHPASLPHAGGSTSGGCAGCPWS